MNPVLIGIASFLAIFGGALGGIALQRYLPPGHLKANTRNGISVSMAVLGTLAALVLSLLITEGSASFVARADAVRELAASIQRLDRSFADYGPETVVADGELHRYAVIKAREVSGHAPRWASATSYNLLDRITHRIMALVPADEIHRMERDEALHVAGIIADERWLLVEKATATLPAPFLILLIAWLAILFTSFGIFAPRNATMLVSLLFCALAISGGIYMIVELANPTRGLLRTPTEPLDEIAAKWSRSA